MKVGAGGWSPSAEITAGIAGLSMLVAVAGLTLAIVNTIRTHRLQFPLPRWQVTWDDRMHEPWMLRLVTNSVRFRIENRGRGAALDVEIEMGGERINDFERRLDLAFAESYEFWLLLDGKPPLLQADAGNGAVDDVQLGGFVSMPPHQVRVTWSQEPNLQRRRSRTYTFSGALTSTRPPWSTTSSE